jgi:hypothetical protein
MLATPQRSHSTKPGRLRVTAHVAPDALARCCSEYLATFYSI